MQSELATGAVMSRLLHLQFNFGSKSSIRKASRPSDSFQYLRFNYCAPAEKDPGLKMTVPESTSNPSTSSSAFTPVSREKFLESSSFYTEFCKKTAKEKLVLIRLPAELSAADLDFQSVEVGEDVNQVAAVFTINSDKSKQPTGRPVRKSPRLTNTYAIRASPQDQQVSAVCLAQPLAAASLSEPQRVRLSRTFDAVWTVGVHVNVQPPPMSRIKKAVQKRAAKPLVEQPKNLKMRLLPFSTPKSK